MPQHNASIAITCMHVRLQDKMGLRETRLLDEVAALRQQLAQEKAARLVVKHQQH